MYDYENKLFEQGLKLICGIDEAGRGPLAGPVFAGAVILDPKNPIPGLKDSKQLSAKAREELAKQIKTKAVCWAVAMVSEKEIDLINIYQASKKAMLLAIEKCEVKPDFLLVDAMPLKEIEIPSLSIIKGDQLSASIAAASIIAKTERDKYMERMDTIYPGYNFARHKGYPTLEHLEKLKELGPSKIHRFSFKPVRDLTVKQLELEL